MIYMSSLYEYRYVYMGSGKVEPRDDKGNLPPTSNYVDEDKGGWIAAEIIWGFILGGLYVYFYFICAKFDDTYYDEDAR